MSRETGVKIEAAASSTEAPSPAAARATAGYAGSARGLSQRSTTAARRSRVTGLLRWSSIPAARLFRPELPARDRGEEVVGQVVPEPGNQATQAASAAPRVARSPLADRTSAVSEGLLSRRRN